MSRLKTSLDHKRIRRLVWLVLTVFVLFCYSLQNVAGSTYYSMLMQAYGMVGSPPVILEEGTAGTSTIYANDTCAKASVEPPLFDYVDNNDPDVDSSVDKGMHSNFPAQQVGPDSIYDTLAEENTGAILDYVDNNSSDVDSLPDVGTHSNFENEKLIDGIYDNLTESCTRGDGVAQGQDISATVTFSHTLGYSSGNNRLVVVATGFENSVGDINIGSATYDGQSMTKIVQATTGGGGYVASVALFYLLDSGLPSSSGFYSVVVTADSDPSGDLWACAVSYIGVKQEAPVDYDSDYYVGSITMTSDLDCDEDGSMLVQACVVGNTGSFGPSLGTAEVIEDSDISSASAAFNEKLGQDSGARDLGCTHGSMNRGAWVGACWAPLGYDLDMEVQFTSVVDFLPTEKLCIYTGSLGDEDLGVDYWNGTGWENLATDLTAYSCNEFTASLTSVNFTIRFNGGTESSDTTEDQWQIDACLLRVEGAGDKEDAVDNDTYDVDGSDDVGTLSNFDNMKTKDGMANLTEGEVVGKTVWLWQEDTSAYSATLSYETYQFWNSWTTNSTTSGTVTKIGIYVFADPGNSPQVKLGIYEDNSTNPGSPGNLLGETNAATITGAGWLDLDIVGGGVSISASTTYHVAHITDVAPITQWRYRKTATPVSDYRTPRATWDNLFDPAGTTSKSASYRYGAYRVGYDEPSDYRLDQEVQWTDVPYLLPNENLSIYGGTMGDEDIEVDVWNGTGWENLFSDLSAGWNNASITDWLTISNFTIRFKGGNETGDPTQHTWQIDVALIHIWHEGGESYEFDLEVQWTSAGYTKTNEELCIRTGTFSGSENIQVEVWNTTGSSWDWVMNITASQWNNMSVTSHLTSSTFTVRFLGGIEMGDTTQDTWDIDATLLHVWTEEATYDYVLGVNNIETDSWQVRLKKYSDSNTDRLRNCTIYFHNSSDGTSRQIYIENGVYINQTGPWYDLGDSETIYIAMTVEASSTGTSYVRAYLEILVPNTSTYVQYVIAFEIT